MVTGASGSPRANKGALSPPLSKSKTAGVGTKSSGDGPESAPEGGLGSPAMALSIRNGRCEVNLELECAWQLIYDRVHALGVLESLDAIAEPHDWSTGLDGGPRKVIREDHRIAEPDSEI